MKKRIPSVPPLEIQFRVHYATKWGESIWVVGDLPELGAWDPTQALPLEWHGGGEWRKTLLVGFEAKVVRYKYAKFEGSAFSCIPEYEPRIVRELEVLGGKNVFCKDAWGDGPSIQEIPIPPKFSGKLFRGPLPGSARFDPHQRAYREMLSANIDVVVVLNERKEYLRYLNGVDIIMQYGRDGMAVIHHPICDFDVPHSRGGIRVLIASINKFLEGGMSVLIHCHAGIGRTGLVMSCFAKSYIGETEPVKWLRQTVIGAVQTDKQLKFDSVACGNEISIIKVLKMRKSLVLIKKC